MSNRTRHAPVLGALLLVSLPAAAAKAPQVGIIGFDFHTVAVGATTATADYQAGGTSGGAWVTGGTNGFENWPTFYNDNVSVTRDFGPNTPSMSFTLTTALTGGTLNFFASHNHNYSWDQSYIVSIYLDGSPTAFAAFKASATTGQGYLTFKLPTLSPGPHTIVWDTTIDTQQEYFGLTDVTVATP